MAFNRKQRLRDNIEAIRTAFTLEREQRAATAEERAILRKYCGFGGLKCILNPARELTDAVHWAKSDLELFAPTVELHRLIRENSRDDMEYKRFVDSLKASVLTAFYTPKEITDTIADVLADYSVRPSRVLEPSAGVGVFVDAVLRHNPDADVMAFEKDLLTGTILRQLHPDKKMRIDGFEKIEKPFNDYFDLAVSNIPFGDIAVFDAEFQKSESFGRRSSQKAIHNYFFLKGLDTVRDGGIVAFITSQGVLNSAKTSVRNELFSQANLVSAIRLPNNLFSDNAGTEVGSDLIILQKNLHKMELSQDERLLTVIQTDTKTNLTDNAYLYIDALDNAGNWTDYVVLANPFYEEEPELTPTPTPDTGDDEHDEHCPTDCDCRKNNTSGSSSGSSFGGSSGGASSVSGGSKNAGSSAQTPASSETPAPTTEPITKEDGTGFTQNGNSVTRDLLYDKYSNKQFITIETRNGETFYLVIDYDKPLDEDGERYETYFLNLVDEADLLALVEGEKQTPACSCTTKCEAGAVNTSCEVCKTNMTECTGKEKVVEKVPGTTSEPEIEPEPEKKSSGGAVALLLLLVLGGGGALYWFKFRKKKPDAKGPVDLDDYDYGEDEDDTDYETEPDEPESTGDAEQEDAE